jgi:hypothetical protein
MSPFIVCFSFETSRTTSPVRTVELFQSGFSRVDDTTYLGGLFNLSAHSPGAGCPPGGEPLVAASTEQQRLGGQRLFELDLGPRLAVLDRDLVEPAAELEALLTGRVLDDAVE